MAGSAAGFEPASSDLRLALSETLVPFVRCFFGRASRGGQSIAVDFRKLAIRFLRQVASLRYCGLAPLVALGHTLHAWREEIATMWRFTRNNAITEGFHNKMEVLQRQAYGFRNFQNYRLRVRVMCS